MYVSLGDIPAPPGRPGSTPLPGGNMPPPPAPTAPPPEDSEDPAFGWVAPVLVGFGLVIVLGVLGGYATGKD